MLKNRCLPLGLILGISLWREAVHIPTRYRMTSEDITAGRHPGLGELGERRYVDQVTLSDCFFVRRIDFPVRASRSDSRAAVDRSPNSHPPYGGPRMN